VAPLLLQFAWLEATVDLTLHDLNKSYDKENITTVVQICY